MDFNINSVEDIPGINAKAAFQKATTEVFKEDGDILSTKIDDSIEYMPWGADNEMPYNILSLIEKDETLSTCQIFNAEVCYGAGLQYNYVNCTKQIKSEIDEFFLKNMIPSYYLGVCQDFKHFGFCVSVIILNSDATKIVQLSRKEACYCRFSPISRNGKIEKVYYANWRKNPSSDRIEQISLLDINNPWADLDSRIAELKKSKVRKFAIVTKIPTPDSTYYPIPYYAALFRGNWYNIKSLIGMGKEAKLKNSAPIKYQIEINDKYWERIFNNEKITTQLDKVARVNKEKKTILEFLTGVENSGKCLFNSYYVNPKGEQEHDVIINPIENGNKEGGDWSTDIIEAINMICFTMRVHSNLVGSVPSKSQSNNSGSDKRELYTIAQALQKPYHDLIFIVHKIIIEFNKWKGAYPECPFVMLTTLDENKDAKLVTPKNNSNDDDNI